MANIYNPSLCIQQYQNFVSVANISYKSVEILLNSLTYPKLCEPTFSVDSLEEHTAFIYLF